MSRISRAVSLLHRNERGQIVVLTAGAMVAILGIAALAIDLGFFAEYRRDSRNDADAIALAGVQELATRGLTAPQRQLNALDEAETWAVKNNVDLSEVVSIVYDTTCSGATVPDTVTVRLQKTRTTFLAGVLGIESGTIKACASARTGMAHGGPSLLPIGLLYEDPAVGGGICYYGDGTGNAHSNFYYDPSDGGNETNAPGGADEKCVIKIPRPGAGETWADGNTGPVRLDEISQVDEDNYEPDCDPPTANSGANEYGENIVGESDCPYAPGDLIRSLPGAQTGQTCSRFDEREALPHASHVITDVFMDPIMVNGKPVYTTVDVTNPHFGVIPVITAQSSGTTWVEIIKFVTVYIIGCDTTGGGNNALYTVSIIPVDSQYFAAGQEIVEPGDPGYTSDWPAFTVKLIE